VAESSFCAEDRVTRTAVSRVYSDTVARGIFLVGFGIAVGFVASALLKTARQKRRDPQVLSQSIEGQLDRLESDGLLEAVSSN